MNRSLIDILWGVAAVGAGASVALQQVLNARLRTELASPWWAGFVSYFVGMLVMLAAVVAFRAPRLSVAVVAGTSWPSWSGGLFGAIFIATAILAVPRLGVAAVLALIVIGQMGGALVFDHFGFLGIPQHPIGIARLAGVVCLVVGVVLVQR